MENLVSYTPLINLLFVFFVVPMWRLGTAMSQSNKNHEGEIKELKKITRALTMVIMKFLPPDAAREYLKEMEKHER